MSRRVEAGRLERSLFALGRTYRSGFPPDSPAGRDFTPLTEAVTQRRRFPEGWGVISNVKRYTQELAWDKAFEGKVPQAWDKGHTVINDIDYLKYNQVALEHPDLIDAVVHYPDPFVVQHFARSQKLSPRHMAVVIARTDVGEGALFAQRGKYPSEEGYQAALLEARVQAAGLTAEADARPTDAEYMKRLQETNPRAALRQLLFATHLPDLQ